MKKRKRGNAVFSTSPARAWRITFTACLGALCLAAASARAQAPATAGGDRVFQAVANSVVSVHVYEPNPAAARKRVSLGSGVVIAPARVVTNCHVLAPGIAAEAGSRELVVEVKEAGQRRGLDARLTSADPARDLCILDVPGLDLPVVTFGTTRDLQVGQPVFAVGSPRGLELTLSGGLISSLRKTAGEPVIQTDAAISPGSSGGGLFDARGRLIGITTFNVAGGQNLNFALPVEWARDAGYRSVSMRDYAAIVEQVRKLVQGGRGAKGATAEGGRWAFAAHSPQGYEVYLDTGRMSRSGVTAQAWILHNFPAPVTSGDASKFRSRVLLADIDCAGGRWSLRHASTYTEPFATGRRLSADDFNPTESDYRPTTPGAAMDIVRSAVCR